MINRPLFLTAPYLAMWLWLAVPLTLHGLVPLGAMLDRHITLHVGGWVEEMNGVDSLGAAWRILRADRRYQQCRSIRVTDHSTDLVILPAKDQHCRFLRFTRSSSGHIAERLPHAVVFNYLKGLFL